MAVSGIILAPEAIKVFNDEFKMHDSPLAFIIFDLGKDLKNVNIKTTVQKSEVDAKFAEAEANGFRKVPDEATDYALLRSHMLADNLPKYATINVLGKLCFITWCPNDAPVRRRMLSASTKDAIAKKLEGLQVVVQACDEDELSYKDLAEKTKRK